MKHKTMKTFIDIDIDHDILYIGFGPQRGVDHSRETTDNVVTDFDADGKIVGFEIISTSKVLGFTLTDIRKL